MRALVAEGAAREALLMLLHALLKSVLLTGVGLTRRHRVVGDDGSGSDATAFARRASSGIQLLALLGLLPPLSRRPLGTCLRPQRLPQLVVDTCVGVGTSLVGRHGRADRHAPEALTPARGNMMTIISVAGCA